MRASTISLVGMLLFSSSPAGGESFEIVCYDQAAAERLMKSYSKTINDANRLQQKNELLEKQLKDLKGSLGV